MLLKLTCEEFLHEMASDSPAPGGGSAAALAGSLGGALAQMVARLTLGKARFGEQEAEMMKALEKAILLQKELQEKVDEDTRAFNRVMAAFRLPKGTEQEQEQRRDAIQYALRKATAVPMEVAEASLETLKLCWFMVERGNPAALSDAGVGGLLAAAGVLGALLNVETNLGSIKDEAFVSAMRAKSRQLEAEALYLRDEVLKAVKGKFQPPS